MFTDNKVLNEVFHKYALKFEWSKNVNGNNYPNVMSFMIIQLLLPAR